MFFESRVRPPATSTRYASIAQLFLHGRVSEAFRDALELRAAGIRPECVGDYLLCGDISRAAGRHAEYHATIRLAARRFPHDPDIAYSLSRAQYAVGRWRKSLEALDRIESKPHRDVVAAARASVYAAIGRTSKYQSHQAQVLPSASSDPFVCYELAHAARTARDHARAADFARRAVELAPGWMRARTQWCSALLNAGRLDEAREAMERGAELGLEDIGFSVFCAEVDFAQLDFAGAAHRLQSARQAWLPHRDSQLEFLLAHSLWSAGRHDEARRVTADSPLSVLFAEATPGRAAHLPAPFIAQEKDQCVPTSATIVAASQGLWLDPLALYTAMHGCGGTQMWRMAEVLIGDHGCEVAYVEANPEAVMAYIERGVALIGERVGIMSSHVEVICGFDTGLGIFHLRDPETWMPNFCSIEDLVDRYASSGGYLHAIITDDGVAPDARFESKRGAAMVGLARAIANGEAKVAEQCVSVFRGDPQWEVLGDLLGIGVTKSPARTRQDLMRRLTTTNLHPVVAMRAHMMVLADDTADAVAASAERHREILGETGLRFIRMLCDFACGRWPEALALVDGFLETYPESESFWGYRARMLANMGRIQEARQAADIAVDISPDSFANRSLQREMYMSTATFGELRSEIETARQRHPDVVSLRVEHARLLAQYGSDGKETERALRQATKFLPRDPDTWLQLVHWYGDQGRADKVEAAIYHARRWLDETDAPWVGSSKKDEGASAGTASEPPEVARGSQRPSAHPSVAPATESRLSVLDTAQPAIFGDPEATPEARQAAKRLNERDRHGSLPWDEAAVLRAWQVEHCSRSDREAERASAILELRVNGPIALFAQRLLGNLSPENCTDGVVRAVLAWAVEAVPLEDWTSSFRFSLSQFYWLLGELNIAEELLQEILKSHPHHDETLFRIAEIKAHRGQDIAAKEGYEAVLDASPGHVAALRALAQAFISVGDYEKAQSIQERIVLRYPYSLQELDGLLKLVKATKGPDEALCVLKSHAKAHQREWVRALEASLHLDAGRLESAQEKLDHFPVTRQCEENLQIFVMQLRLDEASVAGRDKDYDALSARAFRWFPFDAEFARQRVAFLAPSDPEQAKKVLEVTLQQGNVDRNLMLLDAELYGYDIERAMRVIAEIVPPELVYRALGAAFDVYRPRIDQYSALLGWAVEAFPQVAAIRRMWVELLVDSGRAQDAIVACEQFAADYPEEVLAVLRLRGLCYANIDPDRAIPALRKVLEARSDPQAYNQLAEAYVNTGDEANARRTLEQLFESSPYDGQGLTQLYWLGDSASLLVDRVFGCIEQTAQIPAYLHVLAVQCARETQQTVPMNWYAGAFARLEIAQQGPAVRDELPRLRKCIAQWQKQHPTVPDERVTGPALHVRLWGWPGRTWVPAA